jgi:hypothetical protein
MNFHTQRRYNIDRTCIRTGYQGIFGSKTGGVARGWRKYHNDNVHVVQADGVRLRL